MSHLKPHPAYKDSGVEWLGEIPAHWRISPAKHLLSRSLQYGAIESGDIFRADWPRYIRITDISSEGRLRDDGAKSIDPCLARPYLVKNGDILLARSGATVGKSFFYEGVDDAACFAGYMIRMSANKRKLLPRYLHFFLQSNPYWEFILGTQSQSTIQNVNAEKYGSLPVTLPSTTEQASICDWLQKETTKIDNLIEKKTRFIELLKEKRVAVIIDAISPCEGWGMHPFWALARSKSVSGQPDTGLLSVYLDRGVIPYSEGGGLVHKPAESLEKYQLVEPGDLVMNNQQAWRGSLGVSAYRGIVSPAYLIFSIDREKLDPKFANYMFRARPYVDKFMLASMSVGDIQRQIKWPHLRVVPVAAPAVEQQRSIAARLDHETTRIDTLISLTERSIELLKEKRSALITAAVTGKIDVREAA